MNYNKESLKLHENLKGKLEIKSKVPLKTKDDLSLAYTPGVAEASRKIFQNKEDIYKYTMKGNAVAVISNGSAVLGLGNIGAEASLPVMEGKAILFKEFANIDAIPICLNIQDPKEIIQTIKNITPVFGGINLEDFKAPECFEIEESLQDLGIPVMHDDQHGTAIVVLAGLINSLKIKRLDKANAKIVINGAGAAGIAIAKLLLKYGFKKITILDSKGIIYTGRENLNKQKQEIAELTSTCHYDFEDKDCKIGDLKSALKYADVFIGVSKPNILTKEHIKLMNPKPIIFAMANPDPEILPHLAKQAGACIVATGRSDFPNQVNNVLAFPGVFKGALEIKAKKITDKMKIAAAETLASIVTPTPEEILPSPLDKSIVSKIAEAVKGAYKN